MLKQAGKLRPENRRAQIGWHNAGEVLRVRWTVVWTDRLDEAAQQKLPLIKKRA
jgi:hypothetical protein